MDSFHGDFGQWKGRLQNIDSNRGKTNEQQQMKSIQ